ncbi:MAG: glycosyltransferase [Aromatoleum sp.]|uniref:CgeB family protein n=1 Tax=Aromatoleum sp. TaxID=2307007 RepID=UPI002894D37B|nr:glycosyltransferase [Aromatoleum sp.]MDT3670435.1 glycosyltransferase [Aromatoleum sp.]
MKNEKLLILDGIGGVPLGREIHRACEALGVAASYRDGAEFPKIPLYGLRSAWTKAVNRGASDSFFHLPRLARKAVERAIRREAPAVVLVIGFVYKFIDPAFLLALKRELGFSLVLFDTDSCNLYSKRREFVFFIENELPIYDRILSFSRVTTGFFRDTRGLDATYFPFGASPIDMPVPSGQAHDVLFVGSSDLRRIFLLEHIRDHVSVFGNRWQRNYPLISPGLKRRITDRAVWGEQLHQHFADAKIVLNITRTPFYAAETGISLRIFEALAAGAFLLTDYCDEVAELFTPGVELEMFRSSSELVDKMRFYLENPEARAAVARRGHERFLREFTWERRAAQLLVQLGLRPAGVAAQSEQVGASPGGA